MCFVWHGSVRTEETVNAGPLALLVPLLERLQIAEIIDRHLPPDRQLEYSHGQVLSLLLAARLSAPTALCNVADWAERSGADLFWNIPADKLNDDRLGRALDAFFTARHSMLACVAEQALRIGALPCDRRPFDPTALFFYGAYDTSQPRPADLPLPPQTPSADFPAAHLTYGHGTQNLRLVQVGVTAAVDELGAVPLLNHVLSGNANSHTAIAESFELLRHYLPPPPDLLRVSDRGTFSVGHVARVHRRGGRVLCAVPWVEVRSVFDEHRSQLRWQRASFLSREQQRRRQTASTLPHEYYELAVLQHAVKDPDTRASIPCRLVLVFSSADQKVCQQTRAKTITKIRAGLEKLAATVVRGHAATTRQSVERRVAKLLGRKAAAQYFRWEWLPLTAAEQAALPPPGRGCRRPTQRFVFHFDEAAAAADTVYDGYAALLTTAPITQSADSLFTYYKQQNYVELLHHQWKTPLAVRPVFLKSPERIEALVCLLQMALTAYQILERLYRQGVSPEAKVAEQRMTSETLLRRFRTYGLLVSATRVGRVVSATRLTSRQRQILLQLGFDTPAQILARRLRPPPVT